MCELLQTNLGISVARFRAGVVLSQGRESGLVALVCSS